MAVNTRSNISYGLTGPLLKDNPYPIVSARAPLTTDMAPIGQLWVDSTTNVYYILTSISNGSASWQTSSGGGGAGVFSSVEATSGNITADAGNFVATAGTATIHGTITSSTGNIVATAGNITATAGNIVATAGSITAGTTVTGTTGLTATSGNITASTGQLVAGASAVSAVGVGNIGISAETDTTQSTGTLSIKSASANNGNNAGFILISIGSTTAYIPYFTVVSP